MAKSQWEDLIKIVAISDTHAKWKNLIIPPCDLLISAGDYSFIGERHLIKNFHEWLNKQDANHIISVQGNHETWVEKNFNEAKEIALKACPAVHFIEEGLVEIEGFKIWCSAWTPWFHAWAYNAHRGDEIKRHWDAIPDNTDVLVTHGPAYNILDIVDSTHYHGKVNEHVGCFDLAETIKRVKPDVHICGHIHSGHGQEHIDGTSYYNVSICDEIYLPSYPITIIDLEDEHGTNI